MDRAGEGVRAAARRLLPINQGAWVLDRARTSLRDRTARLGANEVASLDPDELWAETGDRGRGRHAHGFTFFADWVGADPLATPEERSALHELIHATALAWDVRFGANRAAAPEMAYHDETTAQRLLGLVAATDLLELDRAQRADLTALGGRTASILAEPGFHSGLNNHGMFQDLALLAWAALVAAPDDAAGDRAWHDAETRLVAYFQECFTSEGVHVENTPTYHVMVARYLPMLAELFRSAGSPSSALFETLQSGAERYAVHCVAPDGRFPPVSDTQRRALDSPSNLSAFPGGEFEYAATRGERGRRPHSRSAGFPGSGYAMTRSAWGDESATFVYFSCAYNADYHKHSDELSIFLRSDGRDLLCEAGAYGYNWKDPFTKYAYSSAAHSTMLVNGIGLPRTEPALDGAAGPTRLDRMLVDAADDDELDATGSTERYPGRTWSRRLRVQHGDTPSATRITIQDEVRSTVGAANLRFLWHFAPGLRVLLRPRGVELFDGDEKVMELEIRTAADLALDVVEAHEGSSPQGWYHPAFGERVPAPVLTVDCWQQDVELETEMRLSDFAWGAEGRGGLRALVEAGPAVPAWSAPVAAGSDRAVVLLMPSESPGDRDRFVAELEKSGVPHWVVPGAHAEAAAAATPDRSAAAVERISHAVQVLVARQRQRGIETLIGTVGPAFAAGALASFATGAPLVALDPDLPRVTDVDSARLRHALDDRRCAGAIDPAIRLVVTAAGEQRADRAVTILGTAPFERHAMPQMLEADAEDRFSDVLRNALESERGTEARYLAGYDRRSRCFVVEVLDIPSASVAVRVFEGKQQVLSLPYADGASHRIPYEGRGPHRLRIHVRDSVGQELEPFTTGAIRVR